MKFWGFIFLILPLAGQAFVMWRTWQLLPVCGALRWGAMTLMTLAFAMMFINFTHLPDALPMPLATIIYEVGTSWIMILLYLVMLFLVLSLGQLLHLIPPAFLHRSAAGSISVAVLMTAIFTYGYFHYLHKVRVPLEIRTAKSLKRPLRFVVVSDLHLGYHNRRTELARWIDLINREHPDAVLIVGDLVDHSIRPVREQQMAEEFHRVQAPVFACAGNHDYYTGIEDVRQFCHAADITMVQDSVIHFEDIQIVCRDDRTNPQRKSLTELIRSVTPERFIIELDHQPYRLEEACHAGVDIEFAGHTHYGQVWPISWITDCVYEDAWGYLRKGASQFYVSSGLGIWGAKFRIGTQSEYVVADIRNQQR